MEMDSTYIIKKVDDDDTNDNGINESDDNNGIVYIDNENQEYTYNSTKDLADSLIKNIDSKLIKDIEIMMTKNNATSKKKIVKFGRSYSPKDRLIALQVGNYNTLHIYDQTKCTNAHYLESTLKRYFDNNHIRGEWYSLTLTELEISCKLLHYFASIINKKFPTIKTFRKSTKCAPAMSDEKPIKYSCAVCNYSTERKRDLMRHNASIKHKQNVQQDNDTDNNIEETVQFQCMYCENTYSLQSSLSKHMKTCSQKAIDEIIQDNIIKKEDYDKLLKENERLNKQINTYEKQIDLYAKLLLKS